jgi:hypothetical protein
MERLKSYLEMLEAMPDFPEIEKASIDIMIESWRKYSELRFKQKYNIQ